MNPTTLTKHIEVDKLDVDQAKEQEYVGNEKT